MKKFILCILTLFLTGCMNQNIIEVNHSDSDYTIDLIGLIPGKENDYIYLSKDAAGVYVYRLNEDSSYNQFIIDFDTKTFKEVEYKENNEPFVYYKNEDYSILYETEFERSEDSQNSIFVRKYYISKDGKQSLLYVSKENSDEPFSIVRTETHPITNKFMFFVKDYERNVLSISEIEDVKLKEIKTIDLNYKNYEYQYSQYYDNDYAHVFENNNSVLFLTNQEEMIIDKRIENEYELVDYEIQFEIYLKYENESSILIKNGNDERIIQKNINGYVLMEDISSDSTLFYEKDGYQKIVIDGNTYDLGYRPTYKIRKDYIISSYKDYESNVQQSIYIDRNENKFYTLSEYIDLTDIYDSYHLTLIRNYANIDYPHSILEIQDSNIMLHDLPFSNHFAWQCGVDENSIIYTQDTSEGMEIYLVTIEK